MEFKTKTKSFVRLATCIFLSSCGIRLWGSGITYRDQKYDFQIRTTFQPLGTKKTYFSKNWPNSKDFTVLIYMLKIFWYTAK